MAEKEKVYKNVSGILQVICNGFGNSSHVRPDETTTDPEAGKLTEIFEEVKSGKENKPKLDKKKRVIRRPGGVKRKAKKEKEE